MSLNNPYGLNPGWKVDPDGRYDRRPGPVKTRKMTREEKIKYGILEGDKKMSAKMIGTGHKLNVRNEDLVRICKEHGTGKAGYEAISKELGMSWHTAKRYVSERGIVGILKAEKEVAEENRRATESMDNVHTCKECAYGIGTGKEYTCHEGNNFLPVNKNGPACVKFISVNDQSDTNNYEEHVEESDLTGHFVDEKCPECGAHLLKNAIGDKWCSFTGCSYGQKEHSEGIQHNAIPARKGDYIGTYTGKKYWPLDPKPEEVCIEDIAHALSLICRFTGHTKQFYSVADHCLNVERYLRDSCSMKVRLYALLHDAAEAYVCDIARPLKRFIPGYEAIEATNQINIYRAFGLESPGDFQEMLIKYADDYMLAVEARSLMADTAEWNLMEVMEKPTIREYAEHEFLAVFRMLWDEVKREEGRSEVG